MLLKKGMKLNIVQTCTLVLSRWAQFLAVAVDPDKKFKKIIFGLKIIRMFAKF